MADIVINGATYKGVPSIEVPSSDGKTANYIDDNLVNRICSRFIVGELSLPNLTQIGDYAFYYCRFMTELHAPLVQKIGDYAFNACSSLKRFDLPVVTSLSTRSLSYTNLNILIMRIEQLVILGNSNALTSTPIASGTGYIYVPKSLVDSYKTATNWSVYADQFRTLEDYTIDGTITGELDESKI